MPLELFDELSLSLEEEDDDELDELSLSELVTVLLTIDNYMSRSVYGVLNSNFIVCVGYSELFEAIMKQINPNIKIYENSIIVGGRHSDLIVHLIDKKYKFFNRIF